MKTYKLLKELPDCKPWEIIEISEEWKRIWGWDKKGNVSDARKKVLEYSLPWSERLEEVTPNDTAYNGMYVWDKSKVEHYFVDCSLSVDWDDTYSHQWFTFKEEKDAEKEARYQKARKAIWKRSAENDAGYKPDWSDEEQNKRCFDYDHVRGERHRDLCTTYQFYFSLPYFSSSEKATACVEDCKDFLDDLLD